MAHEVMRPFVTDILTTFWRHLRFTEQMYNKMESTLLYNKEEIKKCINDFINVFVRNARLL